MPCHGAALGSSTHIVQAIFWSHAPRLVQVAGRGEGDSSAGLASSAQAEDGGATEHMLLMALETLYKDAVEQDVRLGLLRITLQILQRHGAPWPYVPISLDACTCSPCSCPKLLSLDQCMASVAVSHSLWRAGEQLSAGWEPLLRILEAVPEGGDAPCVSLAFQSVQLLASDYMSALPPPLLRQCLQAAALYGGQQVCADRLCSACGQQSRRTRLPDTALRPWHLQYSSI